MGNLPFGTRLASILMWEKAHIGRIAHLPFVGAELYRTVFRGMNVCSVFTILGVFLGRKCPSLEAENERRFSGTYIVGALYILC